MGCNYSPMPLKGVPTCANNCKCIFEGLWKCSAQKSQIADNIFVKEDFASERILQFYYPTCLWRFYTLLMVIIIDITCCYFVRSCLRDQTWLSMLCWCQIPGALFRLAARQQPREFNTNNTHIIIIDPDYNMIQINLVPSYWYSAH